MYQKLLSAIVKEKVGNRLGRVEPRAVKRRRKPQTLLKNDRKSEKARLEKQKQKWESLDAAA